MSSSVNVKEYRNDIETFENAVKSANGNELKARQNLCEKIISFAKLIRKDFNRQNNLKTVTEKIIDTTCGFGDEEVIFLTNTSNCFGVNEFGEIYAFSSSSGNKYGFKRIVLEELLELPGQELGYLYREFCIAFKEVFKNRKAHTPS